MIDLGKWLDESQRIPSEEPVASSHGSGPAYGTGQEI